MTKTYCDICGSEIIPNRDIKILDISLEMKNGYKDMGKIDFSFDICVDCYCNSSLLYDIYDKEDFEDENFKSELKNKIINMIKEKLECL